MESTDPSLAKLMRPRLEGAVARDRLFARLDACASVPVVWIIGPPGAGKTTLASTYLAARKVRHVWIQADPADGDPASFFFYLHAACRRAGLAGRKLPPLLTRELMSDVPGYARRAFRAVFARFRDGLTLVVDNYQNVSPDSQLHRALAQACDEIPEGGRLLLVSRGEPPAEYARLAASERLARIEWNELKLTREEARAFAQGRSPLPDDAVDILHRNCGGWAAGFTLLRERLARTGLVDHIDTSEGLQTVFDYFAAEALRDTPAVHRETLVAASLMPRFTAAMAIAVTGNASAPQLLQWLHQRHLFTDRRLSGKDVVYEFHPLFRSFLRDQASQRHTPDELADLARRSARVLTENGHAEDAVDLLIEAREHREALAGAIALAPTMVATGRSRTFLEWLARLRDAAESAGPVLDYWRGQALIGPRLAEARAAFERAHGGFAALRDRTGEALAVAGVLETCFLALDDLSLADPWLARLDDLVEPEPEWPGVEVAARTYHGIVSVAFWVRPDLPRLPVLVGRLERLLDAPGVTVNTRVLASATLAEYHLFATGVERAGVLVAASAGRIDAEEVAPLARAIWCSRVAGYFRARGDFARAVCLLDQALALAVEHGYAFLGAVALGAKADLALDRGQIEAGRALLEQMKASLDREGKQALGRFHAVRAKVEALSGNLDAALADIRAACEVVERYGLAVPRCAYRLTLAGILLERGEPWAARLAVEQARTVFPLEQYPRVRAACELALCIADATEGRADKWPARLAALYTCTSALGDVYLASTQPLLARRAYELSLESGIARDAAIRMIKLTGVRPRRPDVVHWPWPLRVHAFGALVVEVDGAPLSFDRKAPRKPLELLQAIVAHGGERVSCETLAQTLWPSTDAAAVSLRVTLTRLRRLLGESEAVQLHDGKVSLDRRRCYLDVWAFEALCEDVERSVRAQAGTEGARCDPFRSAERLASIYTGAFLRDEREQPWMLPMREKLRTRFVRTAAALGALLEQERRTEDALALYERVIAQEPTAERLYRRVMAIQLAEGRRSEAMTTYRRCRDMLSIVLGTHPDAETESLHRAARGT